MTLSAVQNLLQRLVLLPARVSTILLGFSVPISVALDNVLLAVVLLAMLFSVRRAVQVVGENPVAQSAWLLFGALAVAIWYGATPWREAADTLAKYADLAFISLFMVLLSGGQGQQRALNAFLVAMGLTLLLSFLVGLKLLPVQHWMNVGAAADNPTVFHSHITQNNMMAFAVFLALLKLRDAALFGNRLGWGTFAVLGGINALFMLQGRTGYLILLVLLGWFAWTTLARYVHARGKTWGWRQGTAIFLLLLGFVAAAYQASPRLQQRVDLVRSEFQAWQPNHGKDTSTGQRLDFYYNAIQVVQQHPVIGVGTGGFPAAFAKQVQGTDVPATHNPHNEYLMIAVQTGLIGLALLLFMFYTEWRCAAWLDTPFEQDAARGLVLAYLVNCLFNSALLDHSDGLFFAFMTAVLFANLKWKAKHG